MSKWEELGGKIKSGTISSSIGGTSFPNTTQYVSITMAPRRPGRGCTQQHRSNLPPTNAQDDVHHPSCSLSAKSNFGLGFSYLNFDFSSCYLAKCRQCQELDGIRKHRGLDFILHWRNMNKISTRFTLKTYQLEFVNLITRFFNKLTIHL